MHRDLKLKNILLTDKGQVKIADFSYAKFLEGNQKIKSAKVGTLDYMAPEIIRGRKYGFEVDIWSAGVCLYKMLYGRPPFSEKDETKLQESIKAGIFYRGEPISINC